MRIGKLRHRLAIQRATETRDAHGGVTQTWATQTTRWGSVEPLNGRELIQAKQIQSFATHRVRLRNVDVRPTDRILHTAQGLLLNVIHVADIGLLDKELEILAIVSSDLIPLLNDDGIVVLDDDGVTPIYVS